MAVFSKDLLSRMQLADSIDCYDGGLNLDYCELSTIGHSYACMIRKVDSDCKFTSVKT